MTNGTPTNGSEVQKYRLDKLYEDVRELKRVIYGPEGKMGIATMVMLMWRAHVGILCGASGIIGTVVGGVMIYWLTKGQ